MGLDYNKVHFIDEKCLRVIMSCKNAEQLKVAMQYLFLVDKSLRKHVDNPKDMDYLTELIAQRKGFIMGLLWTMQGRDYVINS